MNVFNEKVFTIIWFWLVFLTIANVKSVLMAIARITFRQLDYAYIANYLNLYSKKERFKRQVLVKRFIYDYLAADGVLILRLISENISDLLTSEVVNELWNEYKKVAHFSAKNRERYLASQRVKTLEVTTPSQSHADVVATTRDLHYRYGFR
jgi:hypothetical protein